MFTGFKTNTGAGMFAIGTLLGAIFGWPLEITSAIDAIAGALIAWGLGDKIQRSIDANK